MATGFIHLNGTTYRYAYPVSGPSDGSWQDLVERLETACGHSSGQLITTVPVNIGGQQVELRFDATAVSVWGFWTAEGALNA